MAVGSAAEGFYEVFDKISGGNNDCAHTCQVLLDAWVKYSSVRDLEQFVDFFKREYMPYTDWEEDDK